MSGIVVKRLVQEIRARVEAKVGPRRAVFQVAFLILLLSLIQTASGGFDSDAVSFGHRLVLWLIVVSLVAGQYSLVAYIVRSLAPVSGRMSWLARLAGMLTSWLLTTLEVEALKRTPLLSYQAPDPFMEFALFMLPGVMFVCALMISIELMEARRVRDLAARKPPPLDTASPANSWPEAPVLTVEVQDHYLEMVTENRIHLVRGTMRDALPRLDTGRGLQPHRSWWVAQEAVSYSERRGRDFVLLLKDGREIPVARGRIEALREAGWL